MDLNRKTLIGNLVKDPMRRTGKSGKSFVTFSVATNQIFRTKDGKRENVEYHPIVMWGSLADVAENYLTKGSRIFVEGRNQTRQWKDKAGLTRYINELVASDLIMLNGAKKDIKEDELASEDVDLEDIEIEEIS